MNTKTQRGFSTLELLVAMSIFTVVIGGVLSAVSQSYRGYSNEHTTNDVVWQGRAALDLMVREMRLAGYPARNTYAATANLTSANSNLVASTFVTATATDVVFEADLDGTGIVKRVEYRINGSSLERSAVDKNADGSAPAASYNVVASNVNNGSTPVFTYTVDPYSSLVAPGNTNSVSIQLILNAAVGDPKNGKVQTYTFQGVAYRMNPDL